LRKSNRGGDISAQWARSSKILGAVSAKLPKQMSVPQGQTNGKNRFSRSNVHGERTAANQTAKIPALKWKNQEIFL
jgi:hypothetical protein